MEELEKLYNVLSREGIYTKTFEEFQVQYEDPSYRDKVFDVVTRDGYFTKSREEFDLKYTPSGEKKNPNETLPSDSEEVITDSTTITEQQDGVSDSSEDPLFDLYDDLDQITTKFQPPKFQASVSYVPSDFIEKHTSVFLPDNVENNIRKDPNVIAALKNGNLKEEDITMALKGKAEYIKKLQEIVVRPTQKYEEIIQNEELDNPYSFSKDSELEVLDQGAVSTIINKVKAYNAITDKLLTENPDATSEELEAIFNRPDDPNFYNDEEFAIYEDNTDTDGNVKFRTGMEESNLDQMYDVEKLSQIDGFDAEAIKNFDGYLTSQGFKERYNELLEGETISDIDVMNPDGLVEDRTYDYSGNYNPLLAAERLKAQYLTSYLNKQMERNVRSQILNYQKENNGRFPWMDGVQLNYSHGVDEKALIDYFEEEFPVLTEKLKNQDTRNQELYQEYLDGENPWFTQSIKQGFRSLVDRINSFSAGTYDFIGMDGVADEIRMLDAENDLERTDFMRYAYASGKTTNYGGREYLVDSRGQLYDTTAKINVTNVMDPNQQKAIRAQIQQDGTSDYSFSGSGTVIQTTGVVTDMLFQLALTRGVGNLGTGARSFLTAGGIGKYGVAGEKVLRSIPIKATTTSAMVAQGMLFSTNLGENAYKTALEKGLSEQQALEIKAYAAQQGYMLGALTAPISTQQYAIDKIFGKALEKRTTQGLVNAYLNGGKTGVKNYFSNLKNTIVNNYPIYLRESGKEIFQENVQQAGQVFKINPELNAIAGQQIMNDTITGQEFVNITLMAGLAGLLMPFGGDLSSTTTGSIKASYFPGTSAIDRLTALHQLSKQPEKLKSFLNGQVTNGVYTQDQVNNLLSDLEVYRNNVNNIPTDLDPGIALMVMKDLNTLQDLKNKREQQDPAFQNTRLDKQISDLEQNINNITQYNYVTSENRLKLEEEAADELMKEKEIQFKGVEGDYTIEVNDQEIKERAARNFSRLSADEKLKLVDTSKVEIKTDTDTESDTTTQEDTQTETNIKTDDNAIQESSANDSDVVVEESENKVDSQEVDTEVRSTEENQTEEEVTTEETKAPEDQVVETSTETKTEMSVNNESESAPSKERVDQIVEDIITKTKQRSKKGEETNPEILANNAIQYLEGSKIFQESNDTERETLLREVSQKLGIEIKPPSAKKLLGIPKIGKPTTIQVKNDYEALKADLRKEAKIARDAKLDLKGKRKALNQKVRSLFKEGVLKSRQAKALVNKINSVNLDNEKKVEEVIAYAEKVLNDADYASKLEKGNTLRKKTKRRLTTGRLGADSALTNVLSQIVNQPITDFSSETLDAYNNLLAKVAKRDNKQRLDKDLLKEAQDVLSNVTLDIMAQNQIDSDSDPDTQEEFKEGEGMVKPKSTQKVIDRINSKDVDGNSLIEEDSEFINEKLDKLDSVSLELLVDKLNSSENKENAETVKRVNDYAKNRQSLINKVAKQSSQTKTTELSSAAKGMNVGAVTLTTLTANDLAFLSGDQLLQLEVHLDNIKDGNYTHQANRLAQRIESNRRAENMKPVIDQAVSTKKDIALFRSRGTAKVKNIVVNNVKGRSKDAKGLGVIGQSIRSNPLTVIDDMLGNFDKTTVKDNMLQPTSKRIAEFNVWIGKKTDLLDKAESLLAPKGKETANTTVEKRFKITTLLLGREFLANPGFKGVAKPIDWINATIKAYESNKKKSIYQEKDIEILKEIKNKYTKDGDIDIDALFKDMSPETKQALNLIEESYKGLGELQTFATSIVRGQPLEVVPDYVHHNVLYDSQKDEDLEKTMGSFSKMNLKPGSKSVTSFQRTSGAKAIDFDPIVSALRAVRNTGMDYYLSNEIMTSRGALAETVKIVKDQKGKLDDTKQVATDLESIYNEAIGNVIGAQMSSVVIGGKRMNNFKTIGYYATLASVPRAAAEYMSNLTFSFLSAPSETYAGMRKYGKISMSMQGLLVLENVGSPEVTKLYGEEALGGSRAETGGVVTKGKKAPKRTMSEAGEIAEKVLRYSKLGKIPEIVGKTGQLLISKPDQYVSRPLWFGTFAKSFNESTGKEVDFDKIAENDSAYMNEFRDAIEKASRDAGRMVTRAATSNDPLSGVIKNQIRDGEGTINWYRTINGYMSRFSLNEYATARQSIASLVGRGEMGKVQGAATLAAVMARMSIYVVLMKALSNSLYSLAGFGDKDDEDYGELMYRQAVGAATSLLVRGSQGNIPIIAPNLGIELLNEQYGKELGLRKEEEYDPYRHSLVYSTVTPNDIMKNNLADRGLMIASGPYQPIVRDALRLSTQGFKSAFAKTPEAREKALAELLSARSAVEAANLFGLAPFYRDTRGALLRKKYNTTEVEPLSVEDLKTLDPELYKQLKQQEKELRNDPELKRMREEFKELENQLKFD